MTQLVNEVVPDIGLSTRTRTAILKSARSRRTGHRIAKGMLAKLERERREEIEGHLGRLAEIDAGMQRLAAWLARDGVSTPARRS